jgi:hypothetical protein
MLMGIGDLVQAKGEPVMGIIIEERLVQVGFPVYDVDRDYESQYLVQWFQPPVKMKLTTVQSWRIAKKLELLSANR